MQINFNKKPMVRATLMELNLFCENGKTLKDLGKFIESATFMARKFPTVFVQELEVVHNDVVYLVKLSKLDLPNVTRVIVKDGERGKGEFLDIPTDGEVNWAGSIKSLMEISMM